MEGLAVSVGWATMPWPEEVNLDFILLANAPLAPARAVRPVPAQPGCLALRFGAGPAFVTRFEAERPIRAHASLESVILSGAHSR
jgi:hypothetical protein